MSHERTVYISAPGKVILHGEHAVVYGKSAIAASLNLRTHIQVRLLDDDGNVTINLHNVKLRKTWSIEDLKCFASVFPSVNYTVWSELPTGAGLGSSASLNVCMAAAILLQQGLLSVSNLGLDGLHRSPCPRLTEEDRVLINKWAFQGERIIHGKPSGIDNSVATFGGSLKFQGGKITKLLKMPALRILLTSTHVPRSTKVLVAKVKDTYMKFPDILKPVMDSVEAISEKCQQVYSDMVDTPGITDHYHTLEELIKFNQHLLQVMGVSHLTLDKICQVTSKYSLQSKLTGAGGGGCALTLLRPDTTAETLEQVRGELSGLTCWETGVGGEGVVLCNKHNVEKYIKDFDWI